MAKVIPEDRRQERKELGLDGPRADWIREKGKFLACPVGYELFESSKQHTPGLLVRFVIVEGPNIGKVVERNFWRTPNAMSMLGDFSLAMKYDSPWDADEEADVKQVLTHGDRVLLVTVKEETYEDKDGNEKLKYEASFFDAYRRKFDWTDDLKAMRKEAVTQFQDYMEWRKEHPRGEQRDNDDRDDRGSRGGRGGGNNGGGRGGGGSSGGRGSDSGGGRGGNNSGRSGGRGGGKDGFANDKDIPF